MIVNSYLYSIVIFWFSLCGTGFLVYKTVMATPARAAITATTPALVRTAPLLGGFDVAPGAGAEGVATAEEGGTETDVGFGVGTPVGGGTAPSVVVGVGGKSVGGFTVVVVEVVVGSGAGGSGLLKSRLEQAPPVKAKVFCRAALTAPRTDPPVGVQLHETLTVLQVVPWNSESHLDWEELLPPQTDNAAFLQPVLKAAHHWLAGLAGAAEVAERTANAMVERMRADFMFASCYVVNE